MATTNLIQTDRIIYLKGSISRSNSPQIKAQILAVLSDQKPDSLWIDLGQVDCIDSAGIGLLATVYSLAQKQGCTLTLRRVTHPISMVLEITGLDQVLPISQE